MFRPLSRCLLVALVLASAAACSRPRPAARDNVVLVVIDTLRRDHLAPWGYARDPAPYLSRLAREGVVFDATSPTSWTKPATTSLLTGLHPVRHQNFGRLDGLPASAVTLAERLHAAGWQTLGISANGWVSPRFGLDRGFDHFVDRDSEPHAVDVVRAASAELSRLRPPFFLYVHFVDPHAPYEPRTSWDGAPRPAGDRLTIEQLDPLVERRRPAELLARARDLYDGEIRGADDGLRSLVDGLERRGLMRRTILVVTSDHGEEFEEHGRMGHGLTVDEESVRVPLLVHAPHRFAPAHRGLASLLDVVPTLLEVLGLPSDPADFDGISLAGALRGRGPDLDRRELLFHLDHVDGSELALARSGQKVLLGRRPYRKELYDLAVDPGERHDLLGRVPAARWDELAAALAATYNRLAAAALERRPIAIDDGFAAMLSALGYAGPARGRDPRRIPRRIATADAEPGGLLGWEDPASLAPRVAIGQPGDERYLLRGFHLAETGGRWTKPDAVLLLGAPRTSAATRLVLTGASFRGDVAEVRLRADGREILATTVAPGALSLVAPLPPHPGAGPVRIEILTEPPWVPAEHGAADERSLGVFLSSAAIEPVPTQRRD